MMQMAVLNSGFAVLVLCDRLPKQAKAHDMQRKNN